MRNNVLILRLFQFKKIFLVYYIVEKLKCREREIHQTEPITIIK